METCTDCGATPVTCKYDWGTGVRYGCAAHDPLRPSITATVHVPGFYQSLPQFPVLAITGHLGIAGGRPQPGPYPPQVRPSQINTSI